jgi:hypothetical protein
MDHDLPESADENASVDRGDFWHQSDRCKNWESFSEQEARTSNILKGAFEPDDLAFRKVDRKAVFFYSMIALSQVSDAFFCSTSVLPTSVKSASRPVHTR